MDISSLYTNIHHMEGAETCLKKLEEGKKKSIPSIVIKMILIVLKSNTFIFGNECYRQLTGATLGTPMTPKLC